MIYTYTEDRLPIEGRPLIFIEKRMVDEDIYMYIYHLGQYTEDGFIEKGVFYDNVEAWMYIPEYTARSVHKENNSELD